MSYLYRLYELDRERVHLAQPIERRFEQRPTVCEVVPNVIIETVEIELCVSGDGEGVAIEVHEDFSSGVRLSVDGEIK